jgi:hypothetical protein
MEIALSKVLPIRNPRDFKIHFATWNGIKEPLDVFTQDSKSGRDGTAFGVAVTTSTAPSFSV